MNKYMYNVYTKINTSSNGEHKNYIKSSNLYIEFVIKGQDDHLKCLKKQTQATHVAEGYI